MQPTPRRSHARPVAGAPVRRRTVKKTAPEQMGHAKPAVSSPYQLAVTAILGMALLAGLAAVLVREINTDSATNKKVAANHPNFFLKEEFKEWFATWKERDPYVVPEEFRLVRKAPLILSDVYSSTPVAQEEASRFVFAKDGIKYVDLLASYGEPDTRVDVGGLSEDGARTTAAFCGTACTFDRVFWTDANTFVVLGTIESYKADGTQLCSGEGDARFCYKRLTATEYDLTMKEERVYESADRVIVTDPFTEEKSRAWFAGRPAEEKVAAGIYETSELVPFSGEVISASHRLLGVRTEDGTIRYVVVSHGRVGTKIAVEDKADFGPGSTIKGAGLRDGEKGIIATEIMVDTPGAVFIHTPAHGEVVSRSFTASLSTLPSVTKVSVLVTDPQGEIIVKKTASTLEGEEQEGRDTFTVPVTLPTNLDPEATCVLSVAAQGSTASMTVPFVCGPSPTPVDN